MGQTSGKRRGRGRAASRARGVAGAPFSRRRVAESGTSARGIRRGSRANRNVAGVAAVASSQSSQTVLSVPVKAPASNFVNFFTYLLLLKTCTYVRTFVKKFMIQKMLLRKIV